MNKEYWLGRKRASAEMAAKAKSAEARLVHLDLAGRYSVLAASCRPFLLDDVASHAGERAALGLRAR